MEVLNMILCWICEHLAEIYIVEASLCGLLFFWNKADKAAVEREAERAEAEWLKNVRQRRHALILASHKDDLYKWHSLQWQPLS